MVHYIGVVDMMKHPSDQGSSADVYAGDISMIEHCGDCDEVLYTFAVQADADSDAFARVAGLFNIANTAPVNVSLQRSQILGVLEISITLDQIHASTADLIRRKLEQLTCVRRVDFHSHRALPSSGLQPT